MKIKIALAALVAFFPFSPAYGIYDANITGVVKSILTYSNGRFYIQLENQPTSHPTCDASLFSVDASTPDEGRQQMFARLMLAYSLKEPVNIGYDSQGDCSHGRIRVHRIG